MWSIFVLVIGSTIVVLFSEEIATVLKKLASYPGVMVILPLLAVSFLVISYEDIFQECFLIVQYFLNKIVNGLQDLLPFHRKRLAIFILLYSVTVLPLWILEIKKRKKRFRQVDYGWVVGLIIWISTSLLLLVNME